jgi:DNA-binding PadR family transcriptional regulator
VPGERFLRLRHTDTKLAGTGMVGFWRAAELLVRIPIHRLPIYDPVMTRAGERGGGALGGLGRSAGQAALILASLAEGAKHGYALTKDIAEFAGVRLAPGTLYEALSRLEGQGLIEALASDDRRRPYRLTAVGAQALHAHLEAQRRVADIGLRRLASNWGTA